MFLDH